MSEATTIKQLVELGERVLADSSHIFEDHDHRGEAEDLIAYCLDLDEGELPWTLEPARRVRERFLSLIARRAGGEPFPFLVGGTEFYGIEMTVKPGTFVPRPSSELTVDRALRALSRRPKPVVVDVCTGAGPIALAIAHEVSGAEVWGADISGEALDVGRANAKRLELDNIWFRKADMYRGLPKRLLGNVDLITGHVPYVAPFELEDLPAEVREYEPIHTLTDLSDDGLELMRLAVSGAPEWLKPGGWLLLEMAEDLAAKVRRMCLKAGLEYRGTAADEDRLSVVVEARRSLR